MKKLTSKDLPCIECLCFPVCRNKGVGRLLKECDIIVSHLYYGSGYFNDMIKYANRKRNFIRSICLMDMIFEPNSCSSKQELLSLSLDKYEKAVARYSSDLVLMSSREELKRRKMEWTFIKNHFEDLVKRV